MEETGSRFPVLGSRFSVLTRRAAAVVILAAAAGCAKQAQPDAYGNVEATDVVVSSETAGRLTSFTAAEGATLGAGAVAAAVDGTLLALERDELTAQRAAAQSRVDEVQQQIDALDAQRGAVAAQRDAARAQRDALSAQLDIATRVYERTSRLVAQQAATAQQLDQAERDYRVLGDQIKAQDDQIRAAERQLAAQGEQVQGARAMQRTARAQAAAVDAQVKQLGERLHRTDVVNPVAGTVLTTYAKAGEVVQAGQPLYRIADLRTVDVRAYITEPQLARIRLGQEARVSVDAGANAHVVSGTVAWISSQAEFTPTPIQTREERADHVYAVKIRVPNDGGVLKIGMPAEVQFVAASASR